MLNYLVPPEVVGNRSRIAPEWEARESQRLWFVSAPYGGSSLRFRGEPTSLLYAIAPTWSEIRAGRIPGLSTADVALLNPAVASEALYEELERRLQRQRLRAICISTLTASSAEARRIAALAKRINPSTIVILGGPHEDDIDVKSAVDPEFSRLIDVSVAGDGEYALLELVQLLFEHPDATVDQTKALIAAHVERFKVRQGRASVHVISGGRPHRLWLDGKPLSLDSLPPMPRELIHESDARTFAVFKDRGWNVKTAQVMTQRGCAWRCTFCSESADLNARSVSSVLAEIDQALAFRQHDTDLSRDNYRAIFFDDSTFTTRSPRRRAWLAQLYPELKRRGVEWGCQTRLDQIDEDTLVNMREAGCSYVYVGLESASTEMLRAMVKDQGRQQIDKAFRAANRIGIRLGVSLIFGVAQPGMNATTETRDTITETMDFVEGQCKAGNIVFVSPNIATYYPGTRMTAGAGPAVDFHEPIVHRGFPWNRFEEGEGYHPEGIDEDIARFIIDEGVRRFGEFLVDQDLIVLDEYQEPYRKGVFDDNDIAVVDLNAAAISQPRPVARATACFLETLGDLGDRERSRVAEEARVVAAGLLGLSDEQAGQIVFGRNATEAVSIAFDLCRARETKRRRHVLVSDAENLSVSRVFRLAMDHGNSRGRDLWSSFQDFGVATPGDVLSPRRRSDIDIQSVPVHGHEDEAAARFASRVRRDTSMVVFSHVVRDTGRILPVREICQAVRRQSPGALIVVDGAQAFGALPQLNVQELGCDFYIGAPHKTLGSLPVGILWLGDTAISILASVCEPRECGITLRGMVRPSVAVSARDGGWLSIPELGALSASVNDLNKRGLIARNDARVLDALRARRRSQLHDGLASLEDIEWISCETTDYSNFILSFRLTDHDNRQVAEHLWSERRVFLSYIAKTDVLRTSMSTTLTERGVTQAIQAIRSAAGKATSRVLGLAARA